MGVTLGSHVFVALLYGTAFFMDAEHGVSSFDKGCYDVASAVFFAYTYQAVAQGPRSMPEYFQGKAEAARERRAGALSPEQHWAASGTAQLLGAIVWSGLLLVLLFPLMGVSFEFTALCAAWTALALAHAVGAAVAELLAVMCHSLPLAFSLYPIHGTFVISRPDPHTNFSIRVVFSAVRQRSRWIFKTSRRTFTIVTDALRCGGLLRTPLILCSSSHCPLR